MEAGDQICSISQIALAVKAPLSPIGTRGRRKDGSIGLVSSFISSPSVRSTSRMNMALKEARTQIEAIGKQDYGHKQAGRADRDDFFENVAPD